MPRPEADLESAQSMVPPSPQPQSSAQHRSSKWEALSPCGLKLSSEQPLPFSCPTTLLGSPRVLPMAGPAPDAPTPAGLTFFLSCSCGRNPLGKTRMACYSLSVCSPVPGTEKMLEEAAPKTLTHPPGPNALYKRVLQSHSLVSE